jgi:DNA mismatch repair protein MSH5
MLNQEFISRAQITLPLDFERVFVQDGEVYFKCSEMRELDAELGDLDIFIRDKERIILNELEENILEKQSELLECFKAVSSLDCILSFTDCAADLGYSRPLVIDDDALQDQKQRKQVVYIKEGRHPLQEVITNTEFVPNDVRIDDQDRIVVITGPNFSGKSCYLRQVGLLVYMAHIGSFIPCSEATISLTDQIFARISTIESCSRPQSSYQLELTEMASILLKATPKSLVLMDEVGKGTHPSSGIAILAAALKKISDIGCGKIFPGFFVVFDKSVSHSFASLR